MNAPLRSVALARPIASARNAIAERWERSSSNQKSAARPVVFRWCNHGRCHWAIPLPVIIKRGAPKRSDASGFQNRVRPTLPHRELAFTTGTGPAHTCRRHQAQQLLTSTLHRTDRRATVSRRRGSQEGDQRCRSPRGPIAIEHSAAMSFRSRSCSAPAAPSGTSSQETIRRRDRCRVGRSDPRTAPPHSLETISAFNVSGVIVPVTDSERCDWNLRSAARSFGPTTPSIGPS